jgi:hypothetical protein
VTVLIVAGLAVLLVVAVVLGIVEQARGHHWRRVAAERRTRWEARHREFADLD